MSTIFSKIINKEIPASIVYEDENHLVFLDIGPFTKGLTLIKKENIYACLFHVEARQKNF